MELISLDRRGSVIQMKTSKRFKNSWGVIHGGIVASIADSACGISVWPHLEKGEFVATVSLHIDYISPADSGDILIAKGKLLQQSKRIARAEAVIRNQKKKLIARSYGTYMKLPFK